MTQEESVVVTGGEEPSLAPFQRLSGRRLLGYLFGALLLALLGAIVAGVAGYVGGVFSVMAGFYGIALGGLAWLTRRYGIDLHRLFGPLPKSVAEWSTTLIPLLAMHALVMGAFAVLGLLSYIAPDFALGLVNRSDEAQSIFDQGGPLWVIFLASVVLAPIVEETIFRGILLHRWAWKWNTPRSVIATSVVFGLLHPPLILPQLVAGLILARLYLQSGSLWLAVAGHALINLGVVAASVLPSGEAQAVTLDQLRTMSWVLAIVVVAILVPLASWLRPVFANSDHPLPYER